MNLKQKIQEDIKTALRSSDNVTLSVLRLLIAAVNNSEIDKHNEALTDDEVISLIRKQVKQRREAIELYQKGNRPELADKESGEMIILNKYLPQQIEVGEINNTIEQVIKDLPADQQKDFGLIMKTVMAQTQGRSDGSVVAGLVKQKIDQSS